MQVFSVILMGLEPDERTEDALLALLDPVSRARIARFHHREDALRCLVGRILPIWWARREGLISPGSVPPRIERTPHGKPYFADPALSATSHFNVSHDAERVMLGAQRLLASQPQEPDFPAGRVGVDVMCVPSDLSQQEALMETIEEMLHPAETSRLAHVDPGYRLEWLLQAWTLKESYAKSLGLGLALDFTTLDFAPSPEPSIGATDQSSAGQCELCAGRLELRVDGSALASGWHAAVGSVQEDVDASHLWAATWFESEPGGSCAAQIHNLQAADVVKDLL